MKKLKFYINQIIVDEKSAKLSDFDLLNGEDLEKFSIGMRTEKEEILSIRKAVKIVKEDRFVLIYLEEGEKYPYPEKVVDNKLNEIDNPRSADEIELTDQFFALIDITTSRIFLSDQRRKSSFLDWLHGKIGKDINIKAIIPEDEFVKTLKKIDEISLTVEPNLFNSYNSGTLATILSEDIFGFDAVEATLKIRYQKNKNITEKITSKINDILKRKSDFKNITITGRTSDYFESVFNTEEVVSHIYVSIAPEDSTKKVDAENLLNELILKIKNESK